MPTNHSGFMVQANHFNGHGSRGNFEMVMPNPTGGGLVHFWRDNDDGNLPWHRGKYFGGPEGLVGPSLIQSFVSYSYGNQNSLVVIARVGDRLLKISQTSLDPYAPIWETVDFVTIASGVSGNPALIQSSFGPYGQHEVIVPKVGGGLVHYWFDLGHSEWHEAESFGQDLGVVDAVALIQSNYGSPGNLEIVARVGDRLVHLWRTLGRGNRGVRWTSSGFLPVSGAAGIPAFIQSGYGTQGDFEVITPLAGGGLLHLIRSNDESGFPWVIKSTFGSGNFDAAALIQSNFGPHPGNLEVVGTASNCFNHFYQTDRWNWTHTGQEICIPETFQVLFPAAFQTRADFRYDDPPDSVEFKIVFNKPVDPTTFIYGRTCKLVDHNHHLIQIHDVAWSADQRTVTFKPVGDFINQFIDPYTLSLIGTPPHYIRPDQIYVLTDMNNETLDGDSNGQAGGDYWVNFVPIPGG